MSDKIKTCVEETLLDRLLKTFKEEHISKPMLSKGIQGFFSDKIAIVINSGIIFDIAKRNDIIVTQKEAKEILKIVQEEFDITTGISYDIIRSKIMNFKGIEEREIPMAKKTNKVTGTSKDRLREFLKNDYMMIGGADNMGTAIRDCITDLIHIHSKLAGNKKFKDIVRSADEVYNEEKADEDDEAQCRELN